MKTIFTIARDIDGEVICHCADLASAHEMILELSKEEAYENFAYCTLCSWGPKQTSEDFWKCLEDDIEWVKERHEEPIEDPYWNLVDVCADGFYILETILFD